MIFYFSGTGNSKWVAEQIAEQLSDTATDILQCENDIDVSNEQSVGIVFPVYAWSSPEIVGKFIKKIGTTKAFTYIVSTCGSESGYSIKKLGKFIRVDSSYSVIMPSNYIVAADIESDEIISAKIQNAVKSIETIAKQIKENRHGSFEKVGKLAWLKSSIVSFGFNKFARRTKKFSSTDKCISCGVCAKDCPSGTIEMMNGRPNWKNKNCYMCVRCINECPVHAIEIGKSTNQRQRYTFETVGKKYL